MARRFRYQRIRGEVVMNPYDDKEMREIFIKFAKKTLNLEFISNEEDKYGIDLLYKFDLTWGAEGEDASWNGDRWVSNQRNIFNLDEDTLNIQNSKWHYFGLAELSEKNEGKLLISHSGENKNYYFRINPQRDQICLVDASIVKDFTKVKFVFNRQVNNGYEPEDWICIPKKYVRTFNLQPNGEWIENGKYWGPTEKDIKDMEIEYEKKRVREVMSKKNNLSL